MYLLQSNGLEAFIRPWHKSPLGSQKCRSETQEGSELIGLVSQICRAAGGREAFILGTALGFVTYELPRTPTWVS